MTDHISVSEPKYVAETLAWCNARRKERGKKPLTKLPKGVVGDPRSCPCGTATGLKVFADEYDDPMDGSTHPTPRAIDRFVNAFDKRRLPQYEAKR